MAKFWYLRKEFSFCRLVVVNNDSLLLISKLEHLAFLISRESLVSFSSGIDLIGQDGEKRIILVFHHSFSDSLKSRLEHLLINFSTLIRVIQSGLDFVHCATANLVEQTFEIIVLKPLYRIEHVLATRMEVMLQSFARIAQEVDKGSLLDKVIFFVESNIFYLLLCFLQVLHL